MLHNRRWRMRMFHRLIDGLARVPEAGARMLDHTVVLHTSEFGEAAVHSVMDLPVLLAGGGLRTRRHIDYDRAGAADPSARGYDTDASTHNLFTSILQRFGFEDEHFGNDAAKYRGPLEGLV